MWVNCALYNKKETPVAKLGSRGDAKFEQLWAASGYDQGGRRRRVTGGIAAHKYEPDLEPEPKPAQLPRRASSTKSQRNGRRAVRALLADIWAPIHDLSVWLSLCHEHTFLERLLTVFLCARTRAAWSCFGAC